jgi:AraC-like DNA-binding protein
VSAILLRPLAFALASAPPGPLDAFYTATELTPALLADPDARISPAALRLAWHHAVRLTANPYLALHLATALPPGAFGIVEYVVRSAATAGDAIALGLRYLNIVDEVSRGEMVRGDHPDHVDLLVGADSPIPHEASLAAVVGQARMLAGDAFRPLAVDFAHRPPGEHAVYEAFFRCPVRFGAPHTRLVLSRASLDIPLATADPNLLPILLRAADALLARCATPSTTADEVRRVLADALRTGEADVEHVAAHLGTTARSLQRRLKDEDTTFFAVRDELRRELASTYLDGGLSITEISFLLGFSEASAFFRAFKRWTGTTPQASRLSR